VWLRKKSDLLAVAQFSQGLDEFSLISSHQGNWSSELFLSNWVFESFWVPSFGVAVLVLLDGEVDEVDLFEIVRSEDQSSDEDEASTDDQQEAQGSDGGWGNGGVVGVELSELEVYTEGNTNQESDFLGVNVGVAWDVRLVDSGDVFIVSDGVGEDELGEAGGGEVDAEDHEEDERFPIGQFAVNEEHDSEEDEEEGEESPDP